MHSLRASILIVTIYWLNAVSVWEDEGTPYLPYTDSKRQHVMVSEESYDVVLF